MLFQNSIRREHIEDDVFTIRWELNADPISGVLTATESVLYVGKEHHTWTYSVFARDLDPSTVHVTKPDSGGVSWLRTVSSLYRKAVSATKLSQNGPPLHPRKVCFSVPLASERIDAIAVVESLKAFLIGKGAQVPKVPPEILTDEIQQLGMALAPASGIELPLRNDQLHHKQSVCLQDDLALVREMKLPRVSPDRWTFPLLSLDDGPITVREVPRTKNIWRVTLPGIEFLNTTEWQIGLGNKNPSRYTDLLFLNELAASQFAATCSALVPNLREKLYEANYGS